MKEQTITIIVGVVAVLGLVISLYSVNINIQQATYIDTLQQTVVGLAKQDTIAREEFDKNKALWEQQSKLNEELIK